ncbi:MAG: methionine--tRNA ligase [Acidobacteria bacterium]|nr:MAG: methionine--tRNA ligase [Acidobacteriota bacterium]
MSEQREKFYITTPIYYVNARPHIGHTYTTVVCDAIARRHRMLGHDTLFLTGTDEHGQKIERSAAASGKSPQQFTDEVSAEFRGLWDRMGISYDKFIRTTTPEHKRGVQALFTMLKDRGYIYKGSYTGQYCVSDELYADDNTPGTPCPVCGRVTETVQEENYFFKLSAMQEPLLKLYEENPGLIYPETRRNEVIAFVKGGLRDLSISRTTFSWGIPVLEDPSHVIYVWLDALCNYATAVGFGSPDEKDQERYQHYWPADVHMIGKEIVRFHCVYWPAFLLAAGLPLPKQIVAHGWLLFEESKMSKSRGNIVRSETILEVLGADALRYFLMREIVFGQDGSFSFDALVQRFNSDLANGLGNLASRTLSMIGRYFQGEIPYPSATIAHTPAEAAIAKLGAETIAEFTRLFDAFQFSRALEAVWNLLSAVDKYIVENQPWAVAEKEDSDSRSRLATILYTSAEALRVITVLAHPIIPESTAKIFAQLGLSDIANTELKSLRWGQLNVGTRLGRIEPVFPRADKSAIERMQKMEEERKSAAEAAAATASAPEVPAAAAPVAAATPAAAAPEAPAATPDGLPPIAEQISIDDFAKVDLRVGTVLTAEKVEKADKLLRLTVDIGIEVRQIVAGIAKAYAPETLVGRKVVIVANLAPRKLRGIESQGMIVAASFGEQGTPSLASFIESVPNGARLK